MEKVFLTKGHVVMKLLFVDADLHVVEMFTGWLRTQGYEVHCASTEVHAKIVWKKQQPDLILLSTTLNGVDTQAMWREMQTRHDALVIALAEEKEVEDEVRWLESGADDYLCKPLLPALLLARIRAVSRRMRSLLTPDAFVLNTGGSFRVNSLYTEVIIDGKVAHLTLTEGKLLCLLVAHANTACTVEQIASYIWKTDNEKAISLVKVHICRLRRKIEPTPSNPCYILTIPGEGYTLTTKAMR